MESIIRIDDVDVKCTSWVAPMDEQLVVLSLSEPVELRRDVDPDCVHIAWLPITTEVENGYTIPVHIMSVSDDVVVLRRMFPKDELGRRIKEMDDKMGLPRRTAVCYIENGAVCGIPEITKQDPNNGLNLWGEDK